ncbi:MAG: hypothetical protein ACOY71_06650 [Gemmatimonadota bacterium]
MRPRLTPALALSFALVGLTLSACSETPPQAPDGNGVDQQVQPAPSAACPTSAQIQVMIGRLVDDGRKARNTFVSIAAQLAARPPKTVVAQRRTFELVDYLLGLYQAGRLVGGKSPAAQTALTDLVNALFCFAGLSVTMPPLTLDDDAAAAIVFPSTTTTNVVTGTKFTGVEVPPAGVTQAALVTIRRLPDFPGPLLTAFDQYPLFYEVDVQPASALAQELTLGLCLANSATPPDPARLRVAHNVGTGVEILPLVAAPAFLDCTLADISLGNNLDSWDSFARASWHVLTNGLADLVATPLHAAAFAGTGLGGKTKTFSPFGIVDPVGVLTANSPTSQNASPGTAVASPPSVLLQTPAGQPMPGVVVNFTATSGGGSVTGAPQTTNASGIATLGGWILGPVAGVNTLDATVAAPPLATIQGSPLTFTGSSLAASQLRFRVQPSNTRTGVAIAPAVVVEVVDALGNVVTSASGLEIALALGTNPSEATLGGTRALVVANGVGVFNTLTVNRAGTGYTLVVVARQAGIAGATSQAFDVSP